MRKESRAGKNSDGVRQGLSGMGCESLRGARGGKDAGENLRGRRTGMPFSAQTQPLALHGENIAIYHALILVFDFQDDLGIDQT